jgi:integrase
VVLGAQWPAPWRDRGPAVVGHRLRGGHADHREGTCPGRRGNGRGERTQDTLVVSDAAAGREPDRCPEACLGTLRGGETALGVAHADSGYVAINEAGQPYTPDTLTRMWHKLTKAAGVRPIRLHDARHSCGTALHLRGVAMAVIAKWLDHADAATTARIYAHSQDEAMRAASATLRQVVTPGGGHTGSTGVDILVTPRPYSNVRARS